MKELIKKRFNTLYFFYQYLGRRIYIMLGFNFLMVLMDSFGLAMFIPLLQVADKVNVPASKTDKVSYYTQSAFESVGLQANVFNILLFIIILFCLKGLFFFYASKYLGINEQKFSEMIRTRLSDGLRDLEYKEFVRADIGRLQNSLTGESWRMVYACNQYLEAIKNGMFIVTYLAFAFFIDWKFSILVAIGGGLSNLVYKRFYTQTAKLSQATTKNNHRYGGLVVEILNHFKYIKATGRNRLFFERLNEELHDLTANNIKVVTLSARLNAMREPMMITVICIVIAVHVLVFKSLLSAVILILVFFYRVMQKIMDVQSNWNAYLSAIGAVENIRDLQTELNANKEHFMGTETVEDVTNIALSHVGLNYGTHTVLKDITLDIRKNQSIALVGESGSGKTSIVNVLSTLVPKSAGSFTLNGEAVEHYDNYSFKNKIGYISQEPTIFNASIFDNITFWEVPDDNAKVRFAQVLDMCSLTAFVNSLPDKEHTLLGNNGVNISGGQKQRISIARELYRDIDLLIMDEATSALDSETEKAIQESIDSLKGKITIVTIAHRLSTIKNADVIYLLDKGTIIASGSFQELKQQSDYFDRMTALQGI